MSLQNAEMFAAIRARSEFAAERMQLSILDRWVNNALITRLDEALQPTEVRILIYADGFIDFLDLTHVRTLLDARPYPHISFRVTNAHRDRSQGEARRIDRGPVKLTDLNLDEFEEIWFFGANGTQELAPQEIDLLTQFMKKPKCGGVLVTGDHGPLGRVLAENIPRVGAMRRWDVPGSGPDRISSLVEGPDENPTINAQDESDDRPQIIHFQRFPINAPAEVTLQPHPVLSGLDGPIDVLPDHIHEGEAIAPEVNDTNVSTWPKNEAGTHQEQPVVIAFGDVKEEQLQTKRFRVISAYNGHTVNVGRIVADSSWHHWVDSNLTGFEPTPQGQAALKKFETYFLNCAAWLAPPDKQFQVRHTAWRLILGAKEILEIPPDASLTVFGERAIKELRRFASSSAVSEWVLGPVTFYNALSNPDAAQLIENSSLFNLSVQQHMAGGILRALMNEAGPLNAEASLLSTTPLNSDLKQTIQNGTADALSTLQEQIGKEVLRLQTAVAKLNLNPS